MKNHCVWFSKPTHFNDPYDCKLFCDVGKITDEEWLYFYSGLNRGAFGPLKIDPKFLNGGKPTEELKEYIRKVCTLILNSKIDACKDKGVACFSLDFTNELMWSYYAEGHRGICLEHNTKYEPFNQAIPVNYTGDVPEINISDFIFKPENHAPLKALTTKNKMWQHEQEWRIIIDEGDKPFKYHHWALSAIFFGCSMAFEKRREIAQIVSNFPTRLYTIEKTDKNFGFIFYQVIYNKDEDCFTQV